MNYSIMYLTIALFFVMFLDMNAHAAFPIGSCKNVNCNGSPYDFVWSLVDQKSGLFCFNLVNNKANSSCADSFRQYTRKFVIRSQPLCADAFKQFNVDGLKKNGGVFFDKYNNDTEAELRITSLNFTNNSALSHVSFCIIVNPPCNNIVTFCGGNTCYYSVYDPYTHECCPVCAFRASNNIVNLPPPPSPIHVQLPPPPSPIHVQLPPPPMPLLCGENLNCSCTCSRTT